MTASPESHWFKSSSGGSGTECVECAYTDGGTLIRDSKRVDGPLVRDRSGAWRTFVETLARGSLK
ncbi:DUF397 domain-containing protein [Streptomyces sp. NPDC086766]|uniref:DUF397 domain-containing protein n=1 Tax=Streptomyces sp. NPDC086766 TaxID=3365754 RepID=UPI0038200072